MNLMINQIVYRTINDAVNGLNLDKRKKYYVWDGDLCIKDKTVTCPHYVIKNGLPVKIINSEGLN